MEHMAKNYKKKLIIFFMELKPINNKDIYNINSLLQYKIKFKQPHARCELPQCSKCQ